MLFLNILFEIAKLFLDDSPESGRQAGVASEVLDVVHLLFLYVSCGLNTTANSLLFWYKKKYNHYCF